MPRKKGPGTAKELMDELLKDPGYVEHLEENKRREERNREEYRQAAAALLAELEKMGLRVKAVGDLKRGPKEDWVRATPLLLEWIPRITDPWVKEDVVRTLTVPWARPQAAPIMIEEFRRTPAWHETGLRYAIGNAIATVADDSHFEDLAEIATNNDYGEARLEVIVALGRMKDPRAKQILLSLLEDRETSPAAIEGLGKLRDPDTKSAIEPFLKHPETWIRNEAKKALKKIG